MATHFINVVGNVASGKSFYCKDLCRKLKLEGKSVCFLDDVCTSHRPRGHVIRFANFYDIVIMASPMFCSPEQCLFCQIDLHKNFPGCIIEWKFFEANYEQCVLNLFQRRKVDDRYVFGTLKKFKNYKPPDGVPLIPVWRNTS